MQPITITRPDGTRSTYSNITPASWAALEGLKPLKKTKVKADKRDYPKWTAGVSTRDYVRAYYSLNGHQNPLNAPMFFQPLNDAPASWEPGVVEIETLED